MKIFQNKLLLKTILLILPIFILGLLNGFYRQTQYSEPLIFWSIELLSWVVTPLFILNILYKYYGLRPADYGLRLRHHSYSVRDLYNWSMLALIILCMYYYSTHWFVGLFVEGRPRGFDISTVVHSGPFRLPVILYFAISAALVEEIFYRGLLWRLFDRFSRNKWRGVWFVIVSSALYALVHWEDGAVEMWSAAVYGCVACILYQRLNHLVPLIFSHVVINLISLW